MFVYAHNGYVVSFEDLAYVSTLFCDDFFSANIPTPVSAHGIQSLSQLVPDHYHHHGRQQQVEQHCNQRRHFSKSRSSDNESMAYDYSASDVSIAVSTTDSSTRSFLSPSVWRKPVNDGVLSLKAAATFKLKASGATPKLELERETELVSPSSETSPKQQPTQLQLQPQSLPQITPNRRNNKRRKSQRTVLERNRAAVTKSRRKKRSAEDALSQDKTELEGKHLQLQDQRDALIKEILHLKQAILQHAHCGDEAIDTWIKDGANSFAKLV